VVTMTSSMTQGRSLKRATLVAALLAGSATISTSCGSGQTDRARRFLSLGTAGTGGIYYPLGGAIASRLSVADPSHQYTAEVTGGSVENVNRVVNGEMDFGFSMATTVYEAYSGGSDYPEPLETLRIIAPLYPNVTHVLVSRGSDANSIADLAGQRVSVGSPGSGTEQLARQVLEAYDISYEDIETRYLSFSESANALRDGAIDAALISVGYPAAAVLEATTTGKARILQIDSATQQLLAERYPYYAPGTIPAHAYPGVETDIPTVAVMNWIVATEALDGSVVRLLLDILRDQRDQLIQVNAIANQIHVEALLTAPIPLHPAAAAWLEEQGTRREH
jgi:TRAP transporter TAXI family solute receptor